MSSAVAPAHVKSPTVLGHVGSVPPCGAAPRTLTLLPSVLHFPGTLCILLQTHALPARQAHNIEYEATSDYFPLSLGPALHPNETRSAAILTPTITGVKCGFSDEAVALKVVVPRCKL